MWELVARFGAGLAIAAALDKLGHCCGTEGEFGAREMWTREEEECAPCTWSMFSEYGPCDSQSLQERYTNAPDALPISENGGRGRGSCSRLPLAPDEILRSVVNLPARHMRKAGNGENGKGSSAASSRET